MPQAVPTEEQKWTAAAVAGWFMRLSPALRARCLRALTRLHERMSRAEKRGRSAAEARS
jgi:hypothetical protein